MKTYATIKADYSKAVDNLITTHKGFFAFSESQLIEGMAKIGVTDRSELVSSIGGMILPKANHGAFLDDMDKAEKQYKKELKEAKEQKESAILYELNNHESFYRGNMDDVFEMFEGIYTKDEIRAVYKKYSAIEAKNQDHSND